MANRTKKPIVGINPDGTVAERYESSYACQKAGMWRTKLLESCQTGCLYRGLRWMWEDEYLQAVADGRVGELVFERKTRRGEPYRRSIAFTYDWRGREDDQLVFFFKGATRDILRDTFHYLCSGENGMAGGYELRVGYDVERLWRHTYERLEVWITDYNRHFATLADCLALIEARLHVLVSGHVDFYLIEDFLNLTDRDQRAIDGAWQAVRSGSQAISVTQRKQRTTTNHKNMPKMYLRVPWFVAGYMRGRNDDRQLTEFEPYEFADHDEMMLFLSHNLRFIPEQNQTPYCYSERAFSNILHGKHPGGGKVVVNRNASEWPSVGEFCAITGKFVTDKQDSVDYLCIAMPREILDGGRLHKTNGSYALPRHEAEKFVAYLRDEFKREFNAFCKKDEEVCQQNGINRSDVDRMERFLANYNMPVSVSEKDREALRKMMFRLRKRKSPKPYIGHDLDPFVEHISKEDLEKADRREKRIAKKRNSDENES